MLPEQLEKRKQLWTAFSDLWLDNEVQTFTLNNIALKMKESGYSLAELKYIYQHEVAPVAYRNLRVVAGVWDGFDDEWLHGEIQQNLRKPKVWRKFRFFISRSRMFYATKEHWATLERMFLNDISYD